MHFSLLQFIPIFPLLIIMKVKYLLLLILFFAVMPLAKADPIDGVVWLIKQNNIHRLAALFDSPIEITINGQVETYSRAQAEVALTKFFNEHKPVKVSLLHKVNSNQKFLFGVAILKSEHGTFRIAYTFNQIGGAMKIIEMRIEPEKK